MMSKPIINITPVQNVLKRPPPIRKPLQPNKKFRSDQEIIDLLLDDSGSSSDEDNKQNELSCNNPLCDHKEFTKEELKNKTKPKTQFRDIKSIDDLIDLGKTYHCKKNTMYYDVNLRLLCNLVEPLTKLKNMVGMESVKKAMVDQIIFFLQGFNQREKCNECLDCVYGLTCSKNMNDDMLHTIITGPPGVGKTEMGKILGAVYKAMGVLSKGHMKIATRSDFVAKYLGQTAIKTQELINSCKGGVLFIDEAYALGEPENRDSFSKEAIDTLNQNLSERRDFLCIIAGYADALDNCFFKYNEGLKRRFTFRYDIPKYNSDELMEIFLLKVKQNNWKTEFDGKSNDQLTAFFKSKKNSFPNYGGDIETLFLNCKVIHGRRVIHMNNKHKRILTMSDINEGFNEFIKNRKSKSSFNDADIQMMYNIE